MFPDSRRLVRWCLVVAVAASADAFFLKWGSDTTRQTSPAKAWGQPLAANMAPGYQYPYYSPYDVRKLYQVQSQYGPEVALTHSMAPIPISVPAGAALTPVSLQHVQLVPCMCPVAPEEADKLQDQVGPGPYIAQTYAQPSASSYSVPQQMTVAADANKPNKQ